MFDAGPYIDVVKALLNPGPIYAAMGYFSGLASLIFFLFPLFVAIRLAAEASKMGLKTSIGEAFGDFASTTVRFMMYSVAGFIMFLILFNLRDFFQNLGGTESIEQSLSDFRSRIVASREQQEDWIYTVLKFASDVGNTATVPLFFIIYQVASCVYIFVKHLMQVIFALLVVMTFAYGYLAILSQLLPKPLNLIPGFVKSFLTLGIWIFIEPIALGLVNLLQKPGQTALVNVYGGGLGTTAMNAWFLYTSVLLTVCILILVTIPFIARALAQGEAMAGPLAAGSAALTALLVNASLNKGGEQAKQHGGAMLDNLLPSSDGSRRRDTAYQSVADTASSVFQSDMISGARNLLSGGLGDTTASQSSSPNESTSVSSPGLGSQSETTSTHSPASSSESVAGGQTQSLGDVASPTSTTRTANASADASNRNPAVGDATSTPADNHSPAEHQDNNAAAIYDSALHDYSVGDATETGSTEDAPAGSADATSQNFAKPILDMLNEPPPSVNPENTGDLTTAERKSLSTSDRATELSAKHGEISENTKPIKPTIQGLGDLGDDSHDDRSS